MNTQQIKSIFDTFSGKKIMIIGDVMIDSYMWGKVDRISPEAPVPIIASTKRENRMGGAANVALNVKALGGVPVLCAVIGDDEKGKIFTKLLEKREMTEKGILKSDDRMTTIKTRIISNNQQLLRVDQEKTSPLKPETENEFAKHIEDILQTGEIDAIIFEDYDKGTITPHIIDRVSGFAQKMNIPTLVDPKKRNFNDYRNISLFKPNFKELKEGLMLEIEKGDTEALKFACNILHQRGIDTVFVTLSELGVFISQNGNSVSIPAEIRDIADVSGAGDTVISVASFCLTSRLPIDKIAAIANLAGGLVCEKVGVVPIDKKQLEDECVEYFRKLKV